MDELSDVLDDYLLLRAENALSKHLRVWRMRIFQLRGPGMQADLFSQRSQRLKLRLVLRIWKDKAVARKDPDDSINSLVSDNSMRAHTAQFTLRRPSRKHMLLNTL